MTALRGKKQGKQSPMEDGVEGIRGAFPTEALRMTPGTLLPAHHVLSGGVLRPTPGPFSLLSAEQTPPSAGPTGVIHLTVYHLHIHPKRKHLTVGVSHSTGTRGSLGVCAAGLWREGRSWAPCHFLHPQRGCLGDTHEQVYFFRGSGKCPRESYDVSRPRRTF